MVPLLHAGGAQNTAKLDVSPLLAGERAVDTACASWPASREENFAQLHSSGGGSNNENIGSSSPDPGFDNPRSYRNSAVWTSTNSGMAEDQFTEAQNPDDQQRQSLFMQEYNQLAVKHGLHILLFDEDHNGQGYLALKDCDTHTGGRRGWFARAFGKPPMTAAPRRSSRHSVESRSDKAPGHKRTGSDPAVQSHNSKRHTTDKLKNETLQTLVRICGKSFLYLPSDYATRSLMLPTCLRAAAQYLVQNGPEARGVFRISGSMRVVNELYDYYCADLEYGRDIAATVRSPNLPFHIKVGVHDVASLFKRLLAGLPGGILGQISLFDALAEIHRTFNNRQESSSEQTHMLARLLALAIGSVPSQYQRELICAVFGLLSLIGHTSEKASSLDGEESLLPNSERMGYGALGIIFGPLLLGDLLETSGTERCERFRGRSYTSVSATAPSFPPNTSPRNKADRRPKSMVSDRLPLSTLPMALDKILLANDIAEMVISHWRAVVSQMRATGVMRKESLIQMPQKDTQMRQVPPRNLRPCRSDTFTDNHERTLPPQTPVFYGTRLRKARSASIDLDPEAFVCVKRNTQRPTEMTFEEFAARKKLKTQTSSMSITSETATYLALDIKEPAILPRSTQPLAAVLNNNTNHVSQPTPEKPKRPRRVSNGRPSLFGEKPRMEAPFAKPDFPQPQSTDNNTTPSQVKGTSPSPWKVRLRPVRPVSGIANVNGNQRFTSSPAKNSASRPPEETIYFSSNEAPPSKTAALISRIMNPRHQPANQENVNDKERYRGNFTSLNPKSSYCQGTTNHSPFGHRSEGLDSREPPSKEPNSTGLHEVSTPTPKRHWRSRNIKSSVAEDNYTPRSTVVPPVTPLGKTRGLATRTAEANIQTPLAEIKNDARGLRKSCPKAVVAHTTPPGTGAMDEMTRGNHSNTISRTERKDSKPTAAGNTVKAMAALFDNAIRGDIPVTPPAKQTQKAVWLHENHASSRERMLQYTSSHCPSSIEGRVTPLGASYHTPCRPRRMADAGGETPETIAAKKRNQPRLTKSEDRNGRTSRGGIFAASERRDLARSAGRGVASGRSAEDSKATLMEEMDTQKERPKLQELQRCLQAKSAECQTWKNRAETAERRVAELETFLASMGHGQSLLANGEKPQPWVSFLGGTSDTEDETVSEGSLATVLVRNRLANERRIPFVAQK